MARETKEEKVEEEKEVERTALGDAFAEALLTGSPSNKGYDDLTAEERKLRVDEDLKRQSDARK